MILDTDTVMLTRKEFDDLPEYSCSLPTLTTIGKRWKRGEPYGGPRTEWWMGEYVELSDGKKDMVGIQWRKIEVGTLDVMDKISPMSDEDKCQECWGAGNFGVMGKDGKPVPCARCDGSGREMP